MASMRRSRPPVNALEKEREDFMKQLHLAITKAINQQECAVKEKHLRTTILGTHREHGAGSFWDNVLRLPIEGHPIVAWKFCHVLHKLMREGDPHGHLKDGYGRLILHYCKLLLTKLEFHKRNSTIPGNMVLSEKQLDRLGEKDVNNWFEVAIEMLDYQDEILAVQKAVFDSLDMSRANSLTSSGQCRLAPLILCVLDSSCLYDHLVKMLFKLHAVLPPDTLTGHRDRFNAQFKQLKQFYYTSSNLQYFRHLVSIPPLPDNPPDFLIASEYENYVPFRVLVHGQEPSEPGSITPPDSRSEILDLTVPAPTQDAIFPNGTFDSPPPQPPQQNGYNEKDQIINSLRHDLDDTKAALQRLHSEYQSTIDQYQNRVLQLEHQATSTKEVLEQMGEENERYRLQAESLQNEKNLQTAVKLEESEKKAQTSQEKFNKMKDVYSKLREEHISVLKKVGNLQKELEDANKERMDADDARRHASQELENLRLQEKISMEKVQESAEKGHLMDAELADERRKNEKISEELCDANSAAAAAKIELENKIAALKDAEKRLKEAVESGQTELDSVLGSCLKSCGRLIEESIEEFDNPAHLSVTSSPEFMLTATGPCMEALTSLLECDTSASTTLATHSIAFAHSLASLLLHGKATSNAAPGAKVDELVNVCRSAGQTGIELYAGLVSARSKEADQAHVPGAEMRTALEKLEEKFKALLGRMGDVSSEELGDQMDREMQGMSRAIEEAASKFQDLLVKSRATEKGIRLEVNEKIIDACTGLMKAVLILVEKSRDLQAEIVSHGKGTGSVKEFYKRHHKWTEGLLSAAKSIGVAAKNLVDTADNVLSGKGKFEELMVASQEIAACTAQLVVASRVKAEKDSERLKAVSGASKGVTEATAGVLGTVKAGQQSLTDDQSLDFSEMSFHQSKRLEMETQVRVLELETMVEKERRKLAELRKKHYQMAEETEASQSRESTPRD